MNNGYINIDTLKQVLIEIQQFLIQHKSPNKDVKLSERQRIKLNKQQQQRLRQKLSHLHNADLAHILESLPSDDRQDVWRQIPIKQRGSILLSLSEPVRDSLLETMPINEMVTAADTLDSGDISDLADLAQTLPEKAVEKIVSSLPQDQRGQLEEALSFPAGTVGSLMDFNMVTAQNDQTIKQVLGQCRKNGDLPEHTHHIFITDKNNALLGMLPLQKLVTQAPDRQIEELMNHGMISFLTEDSAEQATFAFNRYDLVSAPVVDENNHLIGRICVDDIMDYMHESSEQQVLHQIGFINKEDRFSGILAGAKNRWLWLAINLITVFLATRVIGMFEDKIVELVTLATLMPIVSASAGNVGNQACTLIIRALALGQITDNNIRQFYIKEVGISLFNGFIWGTLMMIFVSSIYNFGIGAVMGGALLINFVLTSFIAVSIPVIRNKFNLDPAMGAHVLVTFFADAFGFFVFLGMASVFL